MIVVLICGCGPAIIMRGVWIEHEQSSVATVVVGLVKGMCSTFSFG